MCETRFNDHDVTRHLVPYGKLICPVSLALLSSVVASNFVSMREWKIPTEDETVSASARRRVTWYDVVWWLRLGLKFGMATNLRCEVCSLGYSLWVTVFRVLVEAL